MPCASANPRFRFAVLPLHRGMIVSMSKRMNRQPSTNPARSPRRIKQRRTFTLTPESVAFLEELSATRKDSQVRESVSAVLDDLLLAVRKEKYRLENEEKIGKYYDGRSYEERQEEIDWGKLATGEFLAIELNKYGE
jgi:hypothetical protein